MSLFGSHKQSYLGVDLGAGGVKLVELQNEKGRGRLVTYAFTERLPDAQPVNLADAPKETAELLKKMVQKARTSTTKVVTGLPVASVFSSVITVPRGTQKEIEEAIQGQAKKLIPVPLEEMKLDFKIIPAPGEKEGSVGAKEPPGKESSKTVQVLITGAAKAMVRKYVDVFKLAGLELVSLETETLALIRSLVGKDRAATMVVDMGAVRTNIAIVENGIPYVTRSLDMGGTALTKAMSRALSLDLTTAEQMKCDIKSVSTLYPDEGLPKIFQPTLLPMITELEYSMNLYTSQGDEQSPKTIEKIILTGGSSVLPALPAYFSSQLGTKTYVGDPWARVVYPEELRPVLDEIGPRYGVGIGLAMRDIE